METLRGLGFHWWHGVQLETTRYLIGAIGVAAFTWAAGRWIAHRRIQDRRASFADRRREAGQSIQTILVFAVVNLLAFVMIGLGWIRFAAPPTNLGVMLAQVIAMVLLHDAYFYWMNR
jgi:lathosterol oxidase